MPGMSASDRPSSWMRCGSQWTSRKAVIMGSAQDGSTARRAQWAAMANFLRVTDRATLQVRNLNLRYVIEITHDSDTGGATVYYGSYAIAGQPATQSIGAAATVA